MADTIPLITLTTAWTNIYSVTGITTGAALVIDPYNTSDFCDAAISLDEPTDDTAVFPVRGDRQTRITAGETGLWMRAPGGTVRVAIQEG